MQLFSAVPALQQFQQGLLATHKTGGQAPPHHDHRAQLWLSCPWGDYIVGMLIADDIILIASPGCNQQRKSDD
jgi:hypothetical protein